MKKVMTLLVAMAAVASACISTAEAAVGSSEWFFVDTTETHQDYVVTFDPNEGTRKPFLVIEEQMFTAGVSQKLWKNEYVRDGYDFKGWAKDSKAGADAGIVDFVDEQLIPSLDSDMMLYAVWEKKQVMVELWLRGEGGTTAEGNIGVKLDVGEGEEVTLPPCPFKQKGFAFIGWATERGGKEEYTDGATVPSDVGVLFAKWSETRFPILFRANGGEGEIPQMLVDAPGETVTLPLNNGRITKDGHVFVGWSSKDGDVPDEVVGFASVAYADGASVTFDGSKTLFAQWRPADCRVTFEADILETHGYPWTSDPDPKKVVISISGGDINVPMTCHLGDTVTLPSGNYTVRVANDAKYRQLHWAPYASKETFSIDVSSDYIVKISLELLMSQSFLRVIFDPGDGGVSLSSSTYELDKTDMGLAAYIKDLPTATPPKGDEWKFEGWWTTKDDVPGAIKIEDKQWLPLDQAWRAIEHERLGYQINTFYEIRLFARWRLKRWSYVVVDESEESAEPASFQTARTFASYLKSADGGLSGTMKVKTAKEKNGAVAATVTIQPVGGKKRTVKGTVSVADGSGQGALKGLRFTADGVTGTLEGYAVDGAEDAAKSKSADAKAVLESFNGKAYTLALAAADGSGLTAGFSVTFATKGKAKVAGVLPDGTKVTGKAVLIVGENTCCLPIAYSKKSSLGFVLWFDRAGNFLQAGNVTAWKGSGIEVKWSDEVAAGSLGTGLRDGSCLNVVEPPKEIGGAAVVKSLLPVNVEVVKGGTGWAVAKPVAVKMDRSGVLSYGANPAQVKLKYKAKDGTFSGSFVFYTEAGGKLKKRRAVVNGVVVDGVGYGTAVVRKVGAWSVTIGTDRIEVEGE